MSNNNNRSDHYATNFPLHGAAQACVWDIEEIHNLLRQGCPVDSHDEDGRTPLMVAFPSKPKKGQEIWKDVITLLLEHGADVNAADSNGTTILHRAAMRCNWDAVEFLVAHNANINATNRNGRTPMYLWFQWDHRCHPVKEDVQRWQSLGANVSTLLHLSARRGDYEMAEFLLKEGSADANTEDSEGMTPLHHLAERSLYGWEKMAELLVRHGADVQLADKQGRTPLHCIVQRQNTCDLSLDHAKELVKEGADLNAVDRQGQTPLYFAVASGQLRLVHFLVSQGADVNVATKQGETVLHRAFKQGRENLVRWLVKRGANVATKQGETVLHRAFKQGRENLARWLVKRGANVSVVDDKSLSTSLSYCISGSPYPLHRAAEAWDLDEIRNLLESGEHEVDSRDNQGRTPLLVSLTTLEPYLKEQDSWEAVAKLLLENGADINAADSNGTTILHRAAQHRSLSFFVFLMKDHNANVNVSDSLGRLPLYFWVESGRHWVQQDPQKPHMLWDQHAECEVRLLLEQGMNGSALLHLAARQGNWRMADFLLKEHVRVDFNAQDSQGMTPLHHLVDGAKRCNSAELRRWVRLLLKPGRARCRASIQLVDNQGRTPLRMALSSNCFFKDVFLRNVSVRSADNQGRTPLHSIAEYDVSLERAQGLMDSGADINAATNQGETVLHVALKHGRHELARLLVDQGANVNAATIQGETVLHVALKHGQSELAHLLVDRGANINAATNRGESVLHFALKHGRHELARLLVDQGAGVNAVDNQGRTTLHHAAAGGNIYVTELLLNQGAIANVTDNQGQVPLHCAATGGHVGVVEHLLCRGGGISASDNQGRTPLLYAAANNRHDTVHLLLLSGCLF